MRHLGRAFLSLWLAVLGPSLIVWGLWIRGSDTGDERFHQTWDWLADHLAYPLLFAPLADWAWPALLEGSGVHAVIAFLVLVALWSVVIILPFIFLAAWWVGMARTMSSSASTGIMAGSSLQAPSGALYLVTLPLALLWAAVRWIVVPDPTGERPVRRFFSPVVKAFLLSFALITGGLLISITFRESYWEQMELLSWMQMHAWDGYLDTLRVPAVMDDSFRSALNGLAGRYTDLGPGRSEVRTTIVLLAVRHAIVAAAIMLVLRTIWWYSNPRTRT